MEVVRNLELRLESKSDAAIVLNHDALSTTYALFTLVCGLAAATVAFFIIFSRRRITKSTWLFSDFVQGPWAVLVFAMVITTLAVMLAWRKTGKFDRVLPLFTALFLIGVAAWMAIEGGKTRDNWAPPLPFDDASDFLSDKEKIVWAIIAAVTALGAVAMFFTGFMRVDRLFATSMAFFATVALSGVLSAFFVYVFTLVVRTVEHIGYKRTSDIFIPFYGLITGAVVLFFIMIDRVASVLLSAITTSPLEARQPGITVLAENATHRTFSLIRWAFLLVCLAPALLVLYNRFGMQLKEETDASIKREWGLLAALTAGAFGLLLTFGMISTEAFVVSRAVSGIVASLMVSTLIFLLGTWGVYWSNVVAYAMTGLLSMVVLWFFITTQRTNTIFSGVFAGILFVGVNLIGRSIAQIIEQNKEDGKPLGYFERVGVYLAPALLVGFAWALRCRANRTSLALPVIFLVFSAIYTFVYNPQILAADFKPYIKESALMQNVMLQVVCAVAVFIPMVAVSKFVYTGTQSLNVELTDGRVPIAEGTAQFVTYAVLAFAGTLAYDASQKTDFIREFIVEGQEAAKVVYDEVVRDIRDGVEWQRLDRRE
ncbi:unnamed protein product [Durusdinium trenchii]|uniref:Uncharacterized protein n=1 Tax=Durusdinium trenchii TaxID=1381693 RepID=A0ABP0L7Q1_9DINO